MEEERLHDELFRPAHGVAHRADHGVLADDHGRVAREEEIGERGERVAALVERAGERPGFLLVPLDEHAHELGRRALSDLAGEWTGGDDVHRLLDQEVSDLVARGDLGQEVGDLMDRGEALEDGHESPVLALGGLGIDDVVVEEVLARGGGDGEELRARRVDQNGAKAADFRRNVHRHTRR